MRYINTPLAGLFSIQSRDAVALSQSRNLPPNNNNPSRSQTQKINFASQSRCSVLPHFQPQYDKHSALCKIAPFHRPGVTGTVRVYVAPNVIHNDHPTFDPMNLSLFKSINRPTGVASSATSPTRSCVYSDTNQIHNGRPMFHPVP
jgi:hypothetical protein